MQSKGSVCELSLCSAALAKQCGLRGQRPTQLSLATDSRAWAEGQPQFPHLGKKEIGLSPLKG